MLIKTSHHTHYVIGSGANDPQKYSPTASAAKPWTTPSRTSSPSPCRTAPGTTWTPTPPNAPHGPDTVELWHKVTTVEDPEWTRRYHSLDIAEKAFGGSVEITLTDGTVITDEIAVADAHPLGARPFAREQYVNKFRTLAAGLVEEAEIERFLAAVERAPRTGRRRTGPAEHHRRPRRDRPQQRTQGTVLNAVLQSHPRTEAAAAPGTARLRDRRSSSRARSTRSRPG